MIRGDIGITLIFIAPTEKIMMVVERSKEKNNYVILLTHWLFASISMLTKSYQRAQ